jgi:hypothetical protein
MSTNLNYNINVNTDNANKNVDDLNKKLDQTNKSTQGTTKSAKTSAGAFSSIGGALKGLGIITVISKAFEFFSEILLKNEKVSNFLSTGINFLTGVFSDLVTFLVDNVDTVVGFFKDVFQNPKKYIDQLVAAIKNNLLERIKSAIDAFGYLGDIIKNVFTGDFDAAGESAKKFGKEMLDVATGVDDAFDKTAAAVEELVEVSGDYFAKKLKQAQELTDATEKAEIAEARMLQTIKENEIAAEKLRQTRDDDTLSIRARIIANEDLQKQLDKSEKAELKLLNTRLRKINAEIALTGKSKETDIELIKLAGERKDIEEKYTGFRSEALKNNNALLNEELQITKSLAENENKRLLDTEKANNELERDEIQRLENKKKILAEESELELKRLEDNLYNTSFGTTARAEAEIAFYQKVNELAIQSDSLDAQIEQAKYKRSTDALERLVNDQNLEFEFRQEALNKEQEQLEEAFLNKLISQDEYNLKYQELSKKRIAIDAEEFAFQQSLQERRNALISAGLDFLQAATGENEKIANIIFTIQKALEIGRIVSSTAGAIGQVLANTKAIPPVLPPGIPNPAYISAAAFGAKNIAALKIGAAAQIGQIAAATLSRFKGASGGSVGGSTNASSGISASAPITPQRPETATTNLSAQTINAIGNQAIRAYVVETDITSNQKRVQAIKQRARFS